MALILRLKNSESSQVLYERLLVKCHALIHVNGVSILVLPDHFGPQDKLRRSSNNINSETFPKTMECIFTTCRDCVLNRLDKCAASRCAPF